MKYFAEYAKASHIKLATVIKKKQSRRKKQLALNVTQNSALSSRRCFADGASGNDKDNTLQYIVQYTTLKLHQINTMHFGHMVNNMA